MILAWVLANHVVHFLSSSWTGLLHGNGFDPAPFILLNLVFSAVAFYTGALVIIAQKAQTRTDKANEEAAAKHRDGHAKFQSDLLEKNTDLTEQIHTLIEKMNALTEQVHAATVRAPIFQLTVRAMPVAGASGLRSWRLTLAPHVDLGPNGRVADRGGRRRFGVR